MKDDRNWISISELMQKEAGNYVMSVEDADKRAFLMNNLDKLNAIANIKKTDLHIQEVAGDNMTIDVVVEIFNNVNSGGTKLSKGDLALAKICAQWPQARQEMKRILDRLCNAGYEFNLDWLLRCVTVYLTNKPYFSELATVSITDFQTALAETDKLISVVLNHIASRLGLDHDRVLGSRYSIPLMIGLLHQNGNRLRDSREWDKLLYWYIHTFLWGRYSGSTESVLAQDLNILSAGEGIDGLIRQLRQSRGDLTLQEGDFWGWSSGARFYPLLYMMTRVNGARDWGSGIELKGSLLGKMSTLDVHHIFPKHILYEAGYTRSEVNALANYTFLTKDTNIEISDKPPQEYFPVYLAKTPGAMESHWIPMDRALWEVSRYPDFLRQRRELLARAANQFLSSLLCGEEAAGPIEDYAGRTHAIGPETLEEETILSVEVWMEGHELSCGERYYNLVDEDGKELAIIDLAWPNGIQPGLTEPVAFLFDETPDTQGIVNAAGYRYFTDVQSFQKYVESILGIHMKDRPL